MMNRLMVAAVAAVVAGGASAVVEYVHPEIGTEFNGHTTVAAAYPFGMVQAGPDTGNGAWDYCSGYRYADKEIWGFSQTHLSGTGCPDLGDFRLQPGGVDRAYPFDKVTEKIGAGFYEVYLNEIETKVEVTVTPHAAFYRFTFNGDEPAKLLVDNQWMMANADNLETCVIDSGWGRLSFTGKKTALYGIRRTKGWAQRDAAYYLVCDHSWTATELKRKSDREKGSRYVLTFDGVAKGDSVLVKIGLSARRSTFDAERNLAAEIPGWDFDAVKQAAIDAWEKQLSVMTAEGTERELISFYTSLYHLFFQPNNIADVGCAPYYSTFSTWDTFRAAHPLYTILTPEKCDDFIASMITDGCKRGYLPIWTLWGEDTQCMIGTHSIPVIVDWFLKQPEEKRGEARWRDAYALIKQTLTRPHAERRKERWDLYDKYGYYPFDEIKGESVSRTLECAYDDACAAKMADYFGDYEARNLFRKRAAYWQNVFDPETKLVRGRDTTGAWRTPFDPFALGHGADTPNDFTEGNSYQYTWHVMQDPNGLIAAMGGEKVFVERLEKLFTLPSKIEGQGFVSDVSGLIGQYAHGNEPSHHVIYLFARAGRPDLTAKYVRRVFDEFYLPKPDGLCGNDDCGQMSAWYLFSAMGFYPLDPCGGEFIIGAPQFKRIVLNLPNGRKFTVTAKNLSKKNLYVKKVTLDGMPFETRQAGAGYDVTYRTISYADIMKGGELVFEMTDRP